MTLLERLLPELVMLDQGLKGSVPKHMGMQAQWRFWASLALATTPLTEGVTPSGVNPTVTDVTATLAQYGQHVQITDVILDTHEDPVLAELSAALGQTAGETQEMIIYNVIKAGTQVQYSNGSSPSIRIRTVIAGTAVDRATFTGASKGTVPFIFTAVGNVYTVKDIGGTTLASWTDSGGIFAYDSTNNKAAIFIYNVLPVVDDFEMADV
jgi:N4-gp56 family major capsid protein